jgi:hypothetical protein
MITITKFAAEQGIDPDKPLTVNAAEKLGTALLARAATGRGHGDSEAFSELYDGDLAAEVGNCTMTEQWAALMGVFRTAGLDDLASLWESARSIEFDGLTDDDIDLEAMWTR